MDPAEGDNDGSDGVVVDSPLVDEGKEGTKDGVLSHSLEHPAGPNHIREAGGPSGQQNTNEDQRFPECELKHVHAVVVEEVGVTGQSGQQTQEDVSGEGDAES